MPAYDYKCDGCATVERIHDTHDGPTKTRLDQNNTPCTCGGTYRRVFGFSMPPVMQEHYNHTVGKNISSMRQMRDELKRAGDEQQARDGIPRSLVPIDHEELRRHALEAFGDDGLREQHDGQVARGEKPPASRMIL